MNSNFNEALKIALNKEFSYLDDCAFSCGEHAFSEQFKLAMQKITKKSEYTYVSVGSRRIRKKLLAVLVALLALAITGCSIAFTGVVKWQETPNEEDGTLDIQFSFEGDFPEDSGPAKNPVTPAGFTVTEVTEHPAGCMINYKNDKGEEIVYSRLDNIDAMTLSIDNEDNALTETTINGCRGYSYSRGNDNGLVWANRYHLYKVWGNCDMEILWQMAKSME